MKKGVILSILIIVALLVYACGRTTGEVDFEAESTEDLHHVIPGNGSTSCSPYFFVKSNYPSRATLFLESTKADIKITGMIANVKVEQVYVNTSSRRYDAIYIFPGSTRAAVYGMDMTVGKRVIHAKVKEREEARREFEEAREKGKRATLLEQDRPNVFKTEVANIFPGDTIKVELFYTELLESRDAVYEFVYPTAVGPRYSNQEEGFVTQTLAQMIFQKKPKFNIQVEVDGVVPIQNLSASYPVKVIKEKNNLMKIGLNNPNGTEIGADFILRYELQGGKIESGLTMYDHGDEKFFLLMAQPPKKALGSDIVPREYIFIVDVSGSMSGFPLEVSKTVLTKLISSLKPTDRFNVMLFESSNAMLSNKSMPATKENIDKAIRVIDRQSGGGGTELYPALKKAFAYKDPTLDGYARTFIIVTDGYVTIESQAFKLISENLDKANFFPLGIGESVNRYLIEGMAWAGASEPFIIENMTEAQKVGDQLIKTISQPLLTNIQINWNDFEVYDTYPQKAPDVFTDRPVVIYGKYRGNPQGAISISGKTAAGNYQMNIPVKEATKSGNEALRYLWARNKIKYLSDYASCFDSNIRVYDMESSSSEANKQEIIRLGLKYNLLTAYTSFLAVDNDYEENIPEKVYDEEIRFTPPVISACEEFEDADIISCEDVNELIPEEPKEQAVYSTVEEMPSFPGGDKELMKFIAGNLKYPASGDIHGMVVLQFIVDENGNINDVKVLRSLDPEYDKEAIRVIESMPKWNPGKQNGKPVAVYYTLPVRFKLS